MTKLTVAFRNFSHVPKNGSSRNGTGGVVDFIDLAQDRNRWRALVNVVMDLRDP